MLAAVFVIQTMAKIKKKASFYCNSISQNINIEHQENVNFLKF